MKKIGALLSGVTLITGSFLWAGAERMKEIAQKDVISESECEEVARQEQAEPGSTTGLLATERKHVCEQCGAVLEKSGQGYVCRTRSMPVTARKKV
jgi:hypothetical protein